MKLVSYLDSSLIRIGLVVDGSIYHLGSALKALGKEQLPENMTDFLRLGMLVHGRSVPQAGHEP